MLIAGEPTEQVIALAIEVHRYTGRGLLESVHEQCLCHDLHQRVFDSTVDGNSRDVQVPVDRRGGSRPILSSRGR